MNFDEFLQPAIFGLTGKPGAGKSYFATRVIIAEITKGKNRTIVTNVPINRSKLRSYTKKDFNIYSLQTFTDNRHFFTNRGHYNFEIDNTGANIDFKDLLQEDDDGILYVMDEAHLYFNSRNWKHMSQATLSYITTIRHVGDSLIWMCQRFSDIDAQIRGKTQAFHLLRNLEKEKLGMFKRGTGFKCYQYQEEHHISNHATNIENASQVLSYPFDIKVAECYNTSLFNKSHDKKYSIKAIPLNYVIYTVVTLFICLLYWISQGGYTDLIRGLVPNMAQIQTEDTGMVAQANEQLMNDLPTVTYDDSDLPAYNPIEEYKNQFEVPRAFNTEIEDTGAFVEFTEDEYKNRLGYWFGINRKCKLTFISDKVTKENQFDFSFRGLWSEFAQLNSIDLSYETGIWKVQTPYFISFRFRS